MLTIDTTSNDKFYIILKDGVELFKISKRNDLEAVKQYLGVLENEVD